MLSSMYEYGAFLESTVFPTFGSPCREARGLLGQFCRAASRSAGPRVEDTLLPGGVCGLGFRVLGFWG